MIPLLADILEVLFLWVWIAFFMVDVIWPLIWGKPLFPHLRRRKRAEVLPGPRPITTKDNDQDGFKQS